MSGLSLRARMDFAFSAVRVVSTRSVSSSSGAAQPSSKLSRPYGSNRPDSFDRDDRPRAQISPPRLKSGVACLFFSLIDPLRCAVVPVVAAPFGRQFRTAIVAAQAADGRPSTPSALSLYPRLADLPVALWRDAPWQR